MSKAGNVPQSVYHSCWFLAIRLNAALIFLNRATYIRIAQGKKAQRSVCKKKKGSPLPLIGPELKKRPNWLSHKKNRIPDTLVPPKMIFSGCWSNWYQRLYNSGEIKTVSKISISNQRGWKSCFHSCLNNNCPANAPPMGTRVKGPLVIMAMAVKAVAATRCQLKKDFSELEK
jgi:hypothetical protein